MPFHPSRVVLDRLHLPDMGKRSSVRKTGDVRDRRPRAEIQKQPIGDKAARSAFGKLRLDRARGHQEAFGKEVLEVRHRKLLPMDRDQAIDHLALAITYTLHVHGGVFDSHAVRRPPADQIRDLGAADYVLAWQTRNVWTRTANQRALDHDDRPTLLRQVPCEILARLTPADYHVFDVYGFSHGRPHRLSGKNPVPAILDGTRR